MRNLDRALLQDWRMGIFTLVGQFLFRRWREPDADDEDVQMEDQVRATERQTEIDDAD